MAAYGKEAVNAGVGALAGGVAGKAAGAINRTLAKSNAASAAGGVAARAVEEGTSITVRSEEHTSELQSLMRISYAVFCLKKKKKNINEIQLTTQFTHM